MSDVPPGGVKPPEWIHETFPLLIGGKEFIFRTLSFADTVAITPYIGLIKRAIERGVPLESNRHVRKALAIVQPALAADEKAMRALSRRHLDLLASWYALRQPVAAGLFTIRPAEDEEMPEFSAEHSRQGAIIVCTAGALHVGMNVEAFIKERFEFCVAAIAEAMRRPS